MAAEPLRSLAVAGWGLLWGSYCGPSAPGRCLCARGAAADDGDAQRRRSRGPPGRAAARGAAPPDAGAGTPGRDAVKEERPGGGDECLCGHGGFCAVSLSHPGHLHLQPPGGPARVSERAGSTSVPQLFRGLGTAALGLGSVQKRHARSMREAPGSLGPRSEWAARAVQGLRAPALCQYCVGSWYYRGQYRNAPASEALKHQRGAEQHGRHELPYLKVKLSMYGLSHTYRFLILETVVSG